MAVFLVYAAVVFGIAFLAGAAWARRPADANEDVVVAGGTTFVDATAPAVAVTLARLAAAEAERDEAAALVERLQERNAALVAAAGVDRPGVGPILDVLRAGGRLTLYRVRGTTPEGSGTGPPGSGGVRATLHGAGHADPIGVQDPEAAFAAAVHPFVRATIETDTGRGLVTTYVCASEALASPPADARPPAEPPEPSGDGEATAVPVLPATSVAAQVVAAVASDPGSILRSIRRDIEAPDDVVKAALVGLVEAGRIEVVNAGQRGPRKYALADA